MSRLGVLPDGEFPTTGRVVLSALPVARGTRWEIYGPHDDDPAQLTTELYWLL